MVGSSPLLGTAAQATADLVHPQVPLRLRLTLYAEGAWGGGRRVLRQEDPTLVRHGDTRRPTHIPFDNDRTSR